MDTKKIGKFIAENRKAKGMKQKDLAEKLGVSDKTVSRWENGNYMPDLSLLQPLSECLDITLNELLSGERIEKDQIAEKAEESIASTLVYSEQKIKKSKLKIYLVIIAIILLVSLIWMLLNLVFFAEVPYQSGDVSQWEEQYPNHSAFEMGLSRSGQPVFVDTAKAMRHAKVIYSDAIEYLQKEYQLLPFSQYTYKPYMVYGWQIVCEEEAIKEQGRDLTGFLDIYDNCFEWKQLALTKEGRVKSDGMKLSMWELYQIALIIMFLPAALGILTIVLSILDYCRARKLKHLTKREKGVICGLVKSHLFRNETYGEVGVGVLIGWGVAQGEQFWGGMLKKRIPPWFPCVKFQANEKEMQCIMTEGTQKGIWRIGQEVTVLYDEKNPRINMIEGDNSLLNRAKYYAIFGVVMLFISAIAIIMFLC